MSPLRYIQKNKNQALLRKTLKTFRDIVFQLRSHARAYIYTITICTLTACLFFSFDAMAQSSSASYKLDYERTASDAGYKSSASYHLVGAITEISAEGSSASYDLRNIYAGLPSTVICGNGTIEGGEQCEGTDFNGLSCIDFGYNAGYLECVNCQIVNHCYNTGGYSSICGNGIKEAGEKCDDGNKISGDGCSSGCQLEGHRCGNGIIEIGEECDDGNINTGDGCTPTCKIERPEPVCGNGSQEEGEECDDGNLADGDGCSKKCTIEPICGNGKKEKGEDCDDGNLADGDGCSSSCKFEFGFPIPVCGNGIKEMNEDCDDGNLTDGDGCSALCEIEKAPEPTPEKEEELFFIIEPKPVTIFPELRAVAPKVSRLKYHFEDYGSGEMITVLDETPFIVVNINPNETYEMVIYDENDEVISRQGVQADENGVVKVESVPYLDYKTYRIKLFDKFHALSKDFRITIEDRKYRLHESLALDGEEMKEMICLGNIAKKESQFIDGKGKPQTKYFAYFQSLGTPRKGRVNPITIVKVTADLEGNFKIPVPEHLKQGSYQIDMVQVYEDGKVSRNKRYIFKLVEKGAWPSIWILIAIALMAIIGKRKEIKNILGIGNGFKIRVLMSLLFLLIPASNIPNTLALTTTPQVFVYEGKLLNSANNPITTPMTFRFSLWSSDDLVAGDIAGGVINVGAATYAGWQETQSVRPNVDGTFFFELGAITPLPNMNASVHKFLQVEIKPQGSPDIAYEIMDPTGDNGTDVDDRQTIGSSPFTNNADFLDYAELGTNAGDIATLDVGGIWNINLMPGGTNADKFIIDYDDTVGVGGSVELQFGQTLAATLKYDVTNNWFEFNQDVNLAQNEIKNVAIDNQAAAPPTPVTGQIYHNITDNNTYIWNGTSWDIVAGTRVKEIVFNAEYEDAVFVGDGTNNRGTLVSQSIDTGPAQFNYAEWKTARPAMQDVNVVLSIKLPDDFVSFTTTPLKIIYQTSDANIANNKIDVSLFDTLDAIVPLTGSVNLANGSWSTANITFGGAPTFTAGQNITLVIKLSATNVGTARIADVVLEYNGT